jgi:hypothetical protein
LPGAHDTLERALAAERPEENVGTPLGPAIAGAMAHLRARAAARPGRKLALVLTTDGEATECEPSTMADIARPLREAFLAPPHIPTYVIGVFTPDELLDAQDTIDELVAAGGTKRAFVLDPNDDFSQRLEEALRTIRGAALPCEFRIPEAARLALDRARVHVRSGGAVSGEEIPYVATSDRCDAATGGWYYDVDPSAPGAAPSQIVVCESTCARFKSDPGAGVELRFECANGPPTSRRTP